MANGGVPSVLAINLIMCCEHNLLFMTAALLYCCNSKHDIMCFKEDHVINGRRFAQSMTMKIGEHHTIQIQI